MQQTAVRERMLPAQVITLLVSLLVAFGIAPGLGVQQAWADGPSITLVAQGEGTCELVGISSELNTTPWSATYDKCTKLVASADGKIDVSGYSHVVLIAKDGTISNASWNPAISNGSNWVTTKNWMSQSLQDAGAYGYLQSVSSEAENGLTLTVQMTGGSGQGGSTDGEKVYSLSFGLNSPGSSSANWDRQAGESVSAAPSSLSYAIDGSTPAVEADGEISFQLQYKVEGASEWQALGEPVQAERNSYNANKWKAPYSVSGTVPSSIAAGVYDVRLMGIWKIDEKTIEQPSPFSWKMTVGAKKYAVSKTAPVNGKLFLGNATRDDVSEAKEGDIVEVYVEPDSGYEVDAVTVKDEANGDVAATRSKDYERWYSFTMPAKAVTVSVTFKAAVQEKTKVAVPTAKTGLVYTGSEQEGVAEAAGYTLTGNKATDAGTFTATATLAEGYAWADAEGEAAGQPKTITWSIAKKEIAAPVPETGLVANGSEQVGVKDGEGYTLSVNKATDAGEYTATATADANHVFADGKESVEVKWSIEKASGSDDSGNTGGNTDPKQDDKSNQGSNEGGNTNTGSDKGSGTDAGGNSGVNDGSKTPAGAPGANAGTSQNATTGKDKSTSTAPKAKAKKVNTMTVKANTATVKASKLKKAAQTLKVGKVITVKKAKGKLTYAKKSGNKKIAIDKKTGKVTVKKGLKKGTYKVKVAVKAAGNASYKAKTKTVTFKVKVK